MRRMANVVGVVAFLVVGFGGVAVAQNVGTQDLVDGLKDPTRWLSYSGDYTGKRHSPLTGISPANVGDLEAQWTFQTGVLGKFEATPIILDGIIYISGPAKQRVGDRRTDGPHDLAIPARPSGWVECLLWKGQSWPGRFRRQVVHGDA